MLPLRSRLVHDAVVYPTVRLPEEPGKLLMGVFDSSGEYIPGTALDRRAGETGAPVDRALYGEPVDSEVPQAIYAGTLYYHFGHFLLESLARAWYADLRPDLPFVWAGARTWQGFTLKPWQREILEILGIENDPIIAADPTRFRRLHIPDIGYRYDDVFHPQHADFLQKASGQGQIAGKRTWISRSRLSTSVRDISAGATERRLETAGWSIVYPERLSVREQLRALREAEVVAGEEGSAFHSLILLDDIAQKRFEIFRRLGPEHRNMRTIGAARSVNERFHSLEHEVVVSAEGRAVTKLNPSAAEVLDVLQVPVPEAPAPGQPSSTDLVIDGLVAAASPRHVLQVGATLPAVLRRSTAGGRVAVSPRNAYDPRSLEVEGVTTFDLELVQYVDHFHGERPAYDVIVIQGVDAEEIRDSMHVSVRVAHPATTWILRSDVVVDVPPGFVRVEPALHDGVDVIRWSGDIGDGGPTGVRDSEPRSSSASRWLRAVWRRVRLRTPSLLL